MHGTVLPAQRIRFSGQHDLALVQKDHVIEQGFSLVNFVRADEDRVVPVAHVINQSVDDAFSRNHVNARKRLIE
jgi:hypothetical protein